MLLLALGAVAELVTIGSVIPFIAILSGSDRFYELELVAQVSEFFGWTEHQDLVRPITIAFVSIVLLSAALRLVLLFSKNRFIYGIGHDVSVRLYENVLLQPYDWHIERNTSSTIAAVNKVQMVVNGVLRPTMDAALAAVLAVAIVALLAIIEPLVSFFATVVLGLLYLVTTRVTRGWLRKNSNLIASVQTARVKAIQEGLGGIRDIILDSSQKHYRIYYSGLDGTLRKAQAENTFISGAPRYLIEAAGICLIVLLTYHLARQPEGLVYALPNLGALALGAQRLLPLMQQVYIGWSSLMGNRQVIVDVLEYLDLETSESPQQSPAEIGFHDLLELKELRFQYKTGGPWVLDGVNISIPRGARVGIVGTTGSGKSTLIDIVMGLLDPVEGDRRVDGMSIGATEKESWRRIVAHVPQAIFLADASIAENIAFGVPRDEIDLERVRRCATRAQIAEFVESRDGGYNARVGERGVQLSGGQRQRIGIARALYKRAQVLVLDEATSALDSETEQAVMASIAQLGEDLTVFMIAHRVSTLRDCHMIVVLSEGKVLQVGTFDEVFPDVAN